MVGLNSLPPPNEVLRTILLDVGPNDLIAIASVNQHLRRAVPTCIDYALAKRHIAAATHFDVSRPPSHGRPSEELRGIRLDHPLFFLNTPRCGISLWLPSEQGVHMGVVAAAAHAMDSHGCQKRDGQAPQSASAAERRAETDLAAPRLDTRPSTDLFIDLRNAFPDTVTDTLESLAFVQFLSGSAESGFCDSFEFLPPEHPALRSDGRTFLRKAIQGHHVTLVELLEKGVPVDPIHNDWVHVPEFPALFSALNVQDQQKRLEILRLLLHRHPNFYCIFNETTAVHKAAAADDHEALKLFLECGANVDCHDEWNATPLYRAAQRGSLECLVALVVAGANVDALSRKGKTALHAAAQCGSADCVAVLLDAEADVGETCRQGRTALHEACKAGCPATVRILLEHGATVDTGMAVRSPLHDALDHDHETAKDRRFDVFDIVDMLIEEGAELDLRDENLETPLHLAVRSGHIFSAKILLHSGAKPSLRSWDDMTPLLLFAEKLLDPKPETAVSWSREWEELVELFIEKGADLQEKCRFGQTLWQKLWRAGQRDRLLMEWLLKQEGLDGDVRDNFLAVYDRLRPKLDGSL
ncbi:hypothetical protein HDU96_008154 [Phlyctochytrium bullatum]|nr:hypothetical protein HDU96_008154 [Phlyctochytrium bullatum]